MAHAADELQESAAYAGLEEGGGTPLETPGGGTPLETPHRRAELGTQTAITLANTVVLGRGENP